MIELTDELLQEIGQKIANRSYREFKEELNLTCKVSDIFNKRKYISESDFKKIFGKKAIMNVRVEGSLFRCMARLWCYLNNTSLEELHREFYPDDKQLNLFIFSGKTKTVEYRLEQQMLTKFYDQGFSYLDIKQGIQELQKKHYKVRTTKNSTLPAYRYTSLSEVQEQLAFLEKFAHIPESYYIGIYTQRKKISTKVARRIMHDYYVYCNPQQALISFLSAYQKRPQKKTKSKPIRKKIPDYIDIPDLEERVANEKHKITLSYNVMERYLQIMELPLPWKNEYFLDIKQHLKKAIKHKIDDIPAEGIIYSDGVFDFLIVLGLARNMRKTGESWGEEPSEFYNEDIIDYRELVLRHMLWE